MARRSDAMKEGKARFSSSRETSQRGSTRISTCRLRRGFTASVQGMPLAASEPGQTQRKANLMAGLLSDQRLQGTLQSLQPVFLTHSPVQDLVLSLGESKRRCR